MLEASSEVLHIFLDAWCQVGISTGYNKALTDVYRVLLLQQLCTRSIWFAIMTSFNPVLYIMSNSHGK